MGSHWKSPVQAPFLAMYNAEYKRENDFAYLPPSADLFNIVVEDTVHTDFSDSPVVLPIFRTLAGRRRGIDGMRIVEIINSVQLQFFDRYLRGKPFSNELGAEFSELKVEVYKVASNQVTSDDGLSSG